MDNLLAALALHPPPESGRIDGMARRFQFSLRTLLVAMTVGCLVFGVWRLLETYGNRLDVEQSELGAAVRVRFSCFLPFGPRRCNLYVGYEILNEMDGTTGSFGLCQTERSLLCLYTGEDKFGPFGDPCKVAFRLHRREPFVVLQEKMVDVR